MPKDYSALTKKLSAAPLMPILTIVDADKSRALVADLVAAGLGAIEILFRTDAAPDFLVRARQAHPGVMFGAGTILDDHSLGRAVDAGADFLVSPGLTPELHRAVEAQEAILIPGAVTGSEVMQARNLGYRILKYFPAEATNGAKVLAEFGDVFPDIRFIPTGKINSDVLPDYANLANVVAAGGSWMNSPDGLARIAEDIRAFG